MFPAGHLFELVIATSFAAGLNTYATIAALGLLARSDVLVLPPSLHVLTAWPVIAAALALYLVEFVADKIPFVDLVWNALHTFVRVPAAALLAYRATIALPPSEQLLAAAGGSLIALATHSGKTALRFAVTPSPEPFSNIALSLGEDVLAIFITWLAAHHPLLGAVIAMALVGVILTSIRLVVRAVRATFKGAARQLRTSGAG